MLRVYVFICDGANGLFPQLLFKYKRPGFRARFYYDEGAMLLVYNNNIIRCAVSSGRNGGSMTKNYTAETIAVNRDKIQ